MTDQEARDGLSHALTGIVEDGIDQRDAIDAVIAWMQAEGYRKHPEPEVTVERLPDESEPVATNPVLRGVDLAVDRLVRADAFTEHTLRILDQLRADVLGVATADEVRAHYGTSSAPVGEGDQ